MIKKRPSRQVVEISDENIPRDARIENVSEPMEMMIRTSVNDGSAG